MKVKSVWFVVLSFTLYLVVGALSAMASSTAVSSVAGKDKVAEDLNARVNVALKQPGQEVGHKATLSQEAFSEVPSSVFALSPDQIREMRRLYNHSQQAGAFTGDVPAKPTSSSVIADLKPGATPPVIRLASGYVTSVVFYDQSGMPWPIQAYDVGNPKAFNIQWHQATAEQEKTGENMGNTLLIQSMTMYREGNLAVVLRGLNTPIMLTLIPGQQAVDYRVDMHVPRNGPYARPMISALPTESSPLLLDLVNHIIPPGSKQLRVTGGRADAWLIGDSMYVRTPLTLISPGWLSTMSGSDGSVHAYEMKPAAVLVAVENGKIVQLKVVGL